MNVARTFENVTLRGVELSDRRIWIDGALIPWDEANVHLMSQSLQRGSMVFDVMTCHWLPHGPAVFGLRAHTRRFLNSAQLSGMELQLGLDGVLTAVGETVRANPDSKLVKLCAYYPGVTLDVLPASPIARLAIAALDPDEIGEGDERGEPQSLHIPDPRKMPPWVLSPQAKLAGGYLYSSVEKASARRQGYDDILLLDEKGNLAESTTQSFFLVEEKSLYTASDEYVLRGVTRAVVIELAKDEGYYVHETRVPRERIASADEAFTCGTTSSVRPVSRIDGRSFLPAPGPVTTRLAERLDLLLKGRDPLFSPKWMQPV